MHEDKQFVTKVYARFRDDFNSVIALACRKFEIPNGKVYRLIPGWEEIKPGEAVYYDGSVEEVILHPEQAQALMDSLWDIGMRPTHGKGSAGSMAATEDHLKTVKDFADRLLALVERHMDK